MQTPAASAAEPLEAPPLAPGSSEKTLYVRDDPSRSPEPDETNGLSGGAGQPGLSGARVRAARDPRTGHERNPAGGKDPVRWPAHVRWTRHRISRTSSSNPACRCSSGAAAGLYEAETGGGFQLVSVLPNGQPAGSGEVGEEPELGDESTNVRGAISEDGSRVIFSSAGIEEPYEVAEYHRLYMRDTLTGQTLQLNAAQGVGEPVGEESEVGFQAATPRRVEACSSPTPPP